MADLSLTKLNTTFYLCNEGANAQAIDPYDAHEVRWNSKGTASWLRGAFTTGNYNVSNVTIQVIDCNKRTKGFGSPSIGISTTAQNHPSGCANPNCNWWGSDDTNSPDEGGGYNCYSVTLDVNLKARTTYYLYLFTTGSSTSSDLGWTPLPRPLDGETRTSHVDFTFNDYSYSAPPVNYTVTLSKGTGISSVTGGGTYTSGSSVSISATPSSGYEFDNWTGYNTTTSNPYTFTIGQNRTYTANAKLKTYTVSYNKGANGSGTNTSATKTHGTALTLLGETFTRTGYTQTGWATSDGGAKAYNLSASYTTNAAVTLYPVWTVKKYKVTYKPGTYGTGSETSHEKTHGTALTLKSALFTRVGYKQTGWNTKNDGTGTSHGLGVSYKTNAALTLYPEWTADTYTVSYNKGTGGSGTNTSDKKTYNVALTLRDAIFSRTGYSQTGWSRTDNGSKDFNLKGSYTDNAAVTLYPVWTAGSYTISYKKGTNGTGTEATESKTHGINITLKNAIFTRTGYVQTGWATADSGTKAYDLGANYTGNANLTLYPVWTAIQYEIQYHANGGSGAMDNSIHSYGVAKNLTANTYTNSGSKFTGWNTQADGSGTTYSDKASVTSLSTTQGDIIHLYAQWSQTVYTVKFNLNGGSYVSGNYNDMTCERGVTYNVPSGTITYANRTFLGWSTSSSATTATYTTTFSNLGTVGATVTLYAVWKVKTFKIQYNINNGSATTKVTQTYTATSSNTFSALPSGWTKSGYAATGWTTSASKTSVDYLFDQPFTGDLDLDDGETLNLYTVWIKQQPWKRCVGMLYLNDSGSYVYF